MSEAKKKTKRCPYCGGSGEYPFGQPRKCFDCDGAGERCIRCFHPPETCRCPASAFDGDYSEMDRPVI